MKINFTKKEYRTLIKLIQISDWVINSHRHRGDSAVENEAAVVQKIYSHAKEMECEDLIMYSKELGEFFETQYAEFDSEARRYIEEYDEETFWAELIDRLSKRDVMSKTTEEEFLRMPQEEKIRLFCDAEEPWEKEVQEHGLKRIGIVTKN